MGKACVCSKESCISFILRLAMASLFALAALNKFMGGLNNVVTEFTTMFQASWLPAVLVGLFARLLPWLEAVIAIWLLLGVRLKEAWSFTAFTLIALSFGLIVLHQSVADMYVYILIACVGLYFSDQDTCNVKNIGKN